MSTAVFEVAMSITTRLDELKALVKHATKCRDEFNNEKIYNSICRACCVLIASNLEGFLKELSRSLILDLNYYLKDFSKMPTLMQRAFCEKITYFEGIPDKDHQQRIKQLIEFFTKNSVSIDLQAITYKQNTNKNPSPSFIDGAFEKLGIYSILNSIAGTRLEEIFKNNKYSNYSLLKDMSHYRSYLYNFPYKIPPAKYTFNHIEKPTKHALPDNTIWHNYIDEILTRRHSIAHGDTLNNDTSTKQLESDITKLEILMHGLMYSAASQLTSQVEAAT